MGAILRIGVDVGGTNTDAVLMAANLPPAQSILATCKHPTTEDVATGILNAVETVLKEGAIDKTAITALMIGTTAFINSVLEADVRRLSKVAVLRLCGPYTQQCPPFIDVPERLRSIIEGHCAFLKGGYQISGEVIQEIDEKEIVAECQAIKAKGIFNVAIVGVYSPLDLKEDSQEARVAAIVQRELGPKANVVRSQEVAKLGFTERENATILNAAILTFAQRTIRSFQRAMLKLGLNCPLFLTQNDGTLSTAANASRLPIRTFASGQTNSMRGASFLAGIGLGPGQKQLKESIIVMDVGGTTSDFGVLLPSGFPRPAAATIEVGGVRTNFTMPDVLSIGLGGGSLVRPVYDEAGKLVDATVGPDSVGFRLTQDAMCFGGSSMTASDIIVASDDTVMMGEPAHRPKIDSKLIEKAKATMKKLLEDTVDLMKTSPEPVTLLLVGGGSIVAPDALDGVKELIRPPHFPFANAVGAAVAQIAGEVDTIVMTESKSVADWLVELKAHAINRAVHLGALRSSVRIVDVETFPVQYVTYKSARLVVRAVGDLDPTAQHVVTNNELDSAQFEEVPEQAKVLLHGIKQNAPKFDPATYRPNITPDGEWLLNPIDMEWLAIGTYLLGTGGGGTPYPPLVMALEVMRNGGSLRITDLDSLSDDAVISRGCFMGSPSVFSERIQAGTEIYAAAQRSLQLAGGCTPSATIAEEIGGSNGLQPLLVGHQLGIPTLDADLMGRAYPCLDMVLTSAFKTGALAPLCLSDALGNSAIVETTRTDKMVEEFARVICTRMGSGCGFSPVPLKASVVRQYGVKNTLSQSWYMGRAVSICRASNNLSKVPEELLKLQNGAFLFSGKIADVQREVRDGWTWGAVTVLPLSAAEMEHEHASIGDSSIVSVTIEFQNEHLICLGRTASGEERVLAIVPDLIIIIDQGSGSALGTPELRYGLRVNVISLATHPLWQTPEGLACAGPSAFHLEQYSYQPVAAYKEPKSVIQEFRPR